MGKDDIDMRIDIIATLFLLTIANPVTAWTPGVTTPAPTTNLAVNTSQRNDVISFYQNIYKASENFASVISTWSGDVNACNEGTLPAGFADLMRRRVNYYRALAGVSGNIVMNDSSTVVTAGDNYNAPSTTLKSLAAQRAALLLTRNNFLTHNPPPSAACFTSPAGNGCLFGNVAIGIYGPPALDAYMREDVNNQEAGHRRWILFNSATNFATGDIAAKGAYAASNSLYISQRNEEMVTVNPNFIPWPPAGFCPWKHATEYFSLSYPMGNFTNATISVTQNGVAQTVDSINRSQGFGNNGIVWRVPSVYSNHNENDDVTYDITVANIGGGGPTSYSYSVRFINADYLPTPPTLSGLSTVALGGSRSFTVGPVDIAEEYRLEVGKKSALPTTTVEGAEDATAAFVIPGPVTGPGYNVRSTTYKVNGLKSLNLAYTDVSQLEQWVEFDRVLFPKASASISYFRRLSFMTAGTTFVAQYSINNDGRWKDIPGTAMAGTTATSGAMLETESAFTAKLTFALPSETLNQPTRIRLLLRKNSTQGFITTSAVGSKSGAFIDDVSFTNVDWLSSRRLTNYPANSTAVTLDSTTAGETLLAGTQYTLRLQPRVGSTWMTASSISDVTVSSNMAPTLDAIAGPLSINEDANTQTIPLSGISAGQDEIQTLTITATSSNTALIPNPTVNYTNPNSTGSLTLKPALNQSGSATITVTVNDGQTTNNTVVRTFVVNVAAVNDAPTITAITDRAINEDANTGALAFTIGDVDTALASLTMSGAATDTVLVPSSGIVFSGTTASRTVTITPAANRSGSSIINLTVSDGTQSTTTSFVLTVNSVNDVPTLGTLSNLTIAEDAAAQLVNLTGITAGPFETQNLSVTATSSNTAIIPNPTINYTSPNGTGSITFTPLPNANGTVTMTVTVNDGQASNNIVTRTFTVTVTAVNDAPTISPITNRETNEDTSTGAIAFTIADAETPTTSLTVTRASINTTLIPLANAVLGGSGANRTITITPAANLSGTGEIRVTVSDGTLSTTTSFVLTVNPVNDAPTLTAISNPSAISEDAGQQTVNLSGIGTGAGNEVQTLTVTATSSNTLLIPHPTVTYTSPNATGSLRYTPVPNAFGTATITVTVNDGQSVNNTIVRTFSVTVSSVNDAPTISSIPARIMVQNTTSPAIPFIIDDIETAAASLTVTRASSNTTLLPATGIVLGGSGANRTVTLTPAANRTGTANVTITVSDGSASASRVIALTVNAQNTAPTITAISAQTIEEDKVTAAIPFTIGDPELLLDQLTVSASSSNTTLLPASGVTLSGTGTSRFITLSPAANQFGSATITVTVNDGQAANSFTSTTFALTVQSINDAPTISAINDLAIDANQSSSNIPFTVSDVDHAAESLLVTASSSNTSLIPNANIVLQGTGAQRTVRLTPVTAATGESTISVTVSDGTLSTIETFVIVVKAVSTVSFDSWVSQQYPQLVSSSFSDDFDKDGMPNGIEYAFFLDPTKPSSQAAMSINHQTNTMTISMPLTSYRDNVTYAAEYSDDFRSWKTQGVVMTLANGKLSASVPMSGTARYIRWKVTKN
jgi:hypothetical protein